MNLRKNKKGDLLGNVFVVIITLVVFFALYPVLDIMLDLSASLHAGDSSLVFLINACTFVILFGVLKWIFNTTSGA